MPSLTSKEIRYGSISLGLPNLYRHCLAKASLPTPFLPEIIRPLKLLPRLENLLSSKASFSILRPIIVVSRAIILGFSLQINLRIFCSMSFLNISGLTKYFRLKHSSLAIHEGTSSNFNEESII